MERAVFKDEALRRTLEDRFVPELVGSLYTMTLAHVSRSDAGFVLTLLGNGLAKVIVEGWLLEIPLTTQSQVGWKLIAEAQFPWRHLVLSTKEFCRIDGRLDEDYLHEILIRVYGALFHLLEENSRQLIQEARALQG